MESMSIFEDYFDLLFYVFFFFFFFFFFFCPVIQEALQFLRFVIFVRICVIKVTCKHEEHIVNDDIEKQMVTADVAKDFKLCIMFPFTYALY